MSYYYQTHIRNLQQQALIEKQKIAAQLHQQSIFKSPNRDKTTTPNSIKSSRRDEDRQTAAHLERSRLSAELSAIRVKAQNSMNRSRLQAAFQLRKENQKALEQLQRMNHKHAILKESSLREEQTANLNYFASVRLAQQKLRQQQLLQQLSHRQNIILNEQVNTARSLTNLLRERYNYAYPY